MSKKKKMSTAEILAAARKSSSGGSGGDDAAPAEQPSGDPSSAAEASAPAEAAAKKPAPKKPAAKPGERPNVSDILALARAGKEAAGASKPAAEPKKAPPAEKPAAKATPKPAVAEAKGASKASAGPRDTASILAAARKSNKPGPMSKAEAAALALKKDDSPIGKQKTPAPPMPTKPEYARMVRPTVAPASAGSDRRGFLSVMLGSALGIGFTSLAGTMGLWGLALARFMFPNTLREPPSVFKVGFPDGFSPGIVETKFKAQYGVWIVNGEYDGKSQLYALRTVCTHLGCTPSWLEAEQKYKCPCHGSGFYKDGINFEGPAPRPLERYAIRLADDGQIEIDKSRIFQEELGQWNDAACYIPMTA
jgi:cytochrome b6-f complex iron-sulfur subunit